MFTSELTVIGGGLAGSETSWQAAQQGIRINLIEIHPKKETGAYVTAHLAELVCSNSLGPYLIDRASSLFKEELRNLSEKKKRNNGQIATAYAKISVEAITEF